ncbi:MAG: 4Fe-4S dicluster domain-containing protein [Chloroflexi bacterium]|nr:4Fe-4S dicluster domain-containing protein [Chloroflexota bacterium]
MKGNRLNRRDFLKWSAVGGVALAIPPSLGALVRKQPARQGESLSKTKLRQWVMVIDLKKCDGCVTIDKPPQCTEACIKGHYVPEGQQWIEVYQHELPGGGTYFMPTPCYNCENAPCVNVCPVGATYQTPEGIVLIDNNRCIGCRLCMAACPYQRRFFNWGQPKLPPEAHFVKSSPEFPIAKKGTVIKCMFCAHHVVNGELPHCVSGCPMKALYFGDLNEDVATNGVEVVQLSQFLAENNAYRYKENLGTQPRVYYLPGHGEVFGRKATDPAKRQESSWPTEGESSNGR